MQVNAKGKIIITVSHPAAFTVARIMDDLKEEITRYAWEEGIEKEIEITEVNG